MCEGYERSPCEGLEIPYDAFLTRKQCDFKCQYSNEESISYTWYLKKIYGTEMYIVE